MTNNFKMPFISSVGSRTGNRCKKPSNTADASVVLTNGTTDMNTTGMTLLSSISGVDDGFQYIPFNNNFYFYGNQYSSDGSTDVANAIYWNTNNVLGFGVGNNTITWVANTGKGFLLGNADRRTNTCYASNSQPSSGIYILKLLVFYQNYYSDGVANAGKYQIRLIRNTNVSKQYVEVRCNSSVASGGQWSVANGTSFNPNLYITNIASGASFLLTSDLNGSSWTYVANAHISI